MSLAVKSDRRGELLAIEHDTLPFPPVRTFAVLAPSGTVRGSHAHIVARQFLIAVSGTVELDLAYQGLRERVVLDRMGRAALIEAGVWSRQTYLGINPSLLAFSDVPYDPNDYVTDMQ